MWLWNFAVGDTTPTAARAVSASQSGCGEPARISPARLQTCRTQSIHRADEQPPCIAHHAQQAPMRKATTWGVEFKNHGKTLLSRDCTCAWQRQTRAVRNTRQLEKQSQEARAAVRDQVRYTDSCCTSNSAIRSIGF